ncbi:bifunctional 3,4-dihydroxy-2-butanone-4-phosphate synthase/GTP cyclohydrolase II [bacterium]|jgi:3,4-dihydroxy 2-butanone 4-phosphate synthase / GTP cyclohydrolase II|nr:bifunctional 3,4-dihydroxy-2-butanone-4-phosphate synthase/GTP cyclohydrolase II [bacterium]
MSQTFKFDAIEDAIAEIANGRMVIVLDDEDRENEGDLIMAAHYATPDAINFMIKHARGLVCLPATDTILDRLELKEMVAQNTEAQQTAFTVSVDAAPKHDITTGISATERAKTIQVIIDPDSSPKDLVSPGHIFPLRAREMGVLKRAGHTEAATDLARLAGVAPAGVICEIINEDGEMARTPDLFEFAKLHDLKIITIKDLIQYRVTQERFITKVETVHMPTDHGDFQLTCYKDEINEKFHFALVKGDLSPDTPTLVRVHSECLTGDVFGSQRCDCGPQLHSAMQMIEDEGVGVVMYMSQEGRGIGIDNKLKAYKLQEKGADTVEANEKLGFAPDLRDYGVGAQMLLDLGIQKMRLITNNPTKIVGLEGYGLEVVERVPLVVKPGPHNEAYLKVKSEKMGHILS